MKPMNCKNMQNIRAQFRERTGVDPKLCIWSRTRRIITAVLVVCVILLVAAGPNRIAVLAEEIQQLFHPEPDTKFGIGAAYEGNGMVTLKIENYTDEDMVLQTTQLQLRRWSTAAPVETISDIPLIADAQIIPGHTAGTIVLDLRGIYDVDMLEEPLKDDHYYLVFEEFPFSDSDTSEGWEPIPYNTPHFVVRFATETSNRKEPEPNTLSAELLDRMEPELKESIRKIVEEQIWWQESSAEREYKDLCRELKASRDGIYVSPEVPENWKLSTEKLEVIFNDQLALEEQSWQVYFRHSSYDHRTAMPYTTTTEEQIYALYTGLPEREANKGTVAANHELPLAYFGIYSSEAAANPDAFTLLFGQLVTFQELESRQVYNDGVYVCYQITDLVYTDLEDYVRQFADQQSLIWIDEEVMQRIRETYDYFKNPEHFPQYLESA